MRTGARCAGEMGRVKRERAAACGGQHRRLRPGDHRTRQLTRTSSSDQRSDDDSDDGHKVAATSEKRHKEHRHRDQQTVSAVKLADCPSFQTPICSLSASEWHFNYQQHLQPTLFQWDVTLISSVLRVITCKQVSSPIQTLYALQKLLGLA